jgi:dihydrofolate synthase/folylpolyglutamate synthase
MTTIQDEERLIHEKIAEISVPSRLDGKTSLAPITRLLDRLGHPERNFPSVHVGGTSGKGSTSTLIASILSAAGYQVGLFTKPHLASVRERFVVDRQPISPAKMFSLLASIGAVENEKPTWFELMTALAFQYFSDQHVDLGVIEVGLGGTLDATNVLLPKVSVLTNVGLDHTEILGDTVEKIAADKVGIIKPGGCVVSGVSQPSVIEIVEQQCQRAQAPLKLLNRDFHYSNVSLSRSGSQFDFEMGSERFSNLTLRMLGLHQVMNASVALAAILRLREAGYAISEPAIRAGLREGVLPGRMELVQHQPALLLDGAHSPPKMTALVEGIRALFPERRRTIGVLSFSSGHDAQTTLGILSPLLDTVILTEFQAITDYGSKRAQPPDEVAKHLAEHHFNGKILVEPDPFQAVQQARQMAGPQDLICVTGSIFLVGQLRDWLREKV